jgi:O-antigen ligase
MKLPSRLNFVKESSSFLWLFLFLYLLFSMISITISYAVLVLALLFWLRILIKNRRLPQFPSFFWPLLVYSLFSLISVSQSVNPEISLIDSRELLIFLIVPLIYCGMSSAENIKYAQFALLASGGISSLYSLFYFIFRSAPGERITGFMGHPLTQAGILILFLSVALSHSLFSKEKSRFFWAGGCILALVALALTLTRSAWIGLAVAAAFILALYKPKALILIPIVVVLFFLLSPKLVK